jgi:CO/xanthine dehydrogenase Mo-binding subunit/CO/xanthine dehydrogenase FAD-binding subunit
MPSDLKEVGRRIPQKGANARVSGKSIYTQDIVLPGMLFAAVLRSPHAHARIISIDTSLARARNGVCGIITAHDFGNRRYVQLGGRYSDRHPLATGSVRFWGEEVVAVAAETLAIARAALALVEVEYEPLPAALTPEAALAPDAPQIHESRLTPGGKNLAVRFSCDYGDVEAGLAKAAFVLEDEFQHGIVAPCCMETNGTVASYDNTTGHLTLWTATQAPFFIRKEVAHVVDLPAERVHLRSVEVGGGFGGKSKICEQEALAAMLSIKTGRPVKLTLDRHEEFVSGKTDHAKRIRIRTGIGEDGSIVYRATSVQIDNGAYTAYAPTYVGASRQRTTCLYRVGSAHYDCELVYTNKVPGGQYRGMGAPQTIWAIESQIEEAARRLGRDPLAYRIEIANQSGDVTPLGWKITSCGLTQCLQEVGRRIGWTEKRAKRTPYRGVGVAAMIHPSGGVIYQEGNYSNTRVALEAPGVFVVHTQTADAGTWQNTTLAQIAAEALGFPSELVVVSHMDTDNAPADLGSAASRVTFVTGNATKKAALALRERIATALALKWNCAPHDIIVSDGEVRLSSEPERKLNLSGLVELLGPLSEEAKYSTPGEMPDAATGYGNYAATYVFGAQAAEVEVDPSTGQVRILKMVVAQDVGRALNPIAVEGQITGGVLQGIGIALQEELIFEEGRPVNASFLDYKVPRVGDAVPIEIALIETIDAEGPFGAKAAAEPTINATVAAIANAVADALGFTIKELPLTPHRVLTQLVERQKQKLSLKPWKRAMNAEIAAVRGLYPPIVFPALRKGGTKLARLPKRNVTPELVAPTNLSALIEELAQPGRRARVMAGGTDLLVGMKQGIYDPEVLVDLTRVEELRGIKLDGDTLTIGAATSLAALAEDTRVARQFPALVSCLQQIATPQVRRAATVAGDLCQEKRCWFFRSAFPCYKLGGATCPCFAVMGDNRYHSILGARRCAAPCPADLAPMFVALDARVIAVGPRGTRVIPMEDLYLWSGLTCLTRGEIVQSIEIPLVAGALQSFEKFAVRAGDFAEASVAVRTIARDGKLEHIRVALGAVAPMPMRAKACETRLLKAIRPNAADIREAAEAVLEGALPLKDNVHKTHLLVNLAERALHEALQ